MTLYSGERKSLLSHACQPVGFNLTLPFRIEQLAREGGVATVVWLRSALMCHCFLFVSTSNESVC